MSAAAMPRNRNWSGRSSTSATATCWWSKFPRRFVAIAGRQPFPAKPPNKSAGWFKARATRSKPRPRASVKGRGQDAVSRGSDLPKVSLFKGQVLHHRAFGKGHLSIRVPISIRYRPASRPASHSAPSATPRELFDAFSDFARSQPCVAFSDLSGIAAAPATADLSGDPSTVVLAKGEAVSEEGSMGRWLPFKNSGFFPFSPKIPIPFCALCELLWPINFPPPLTPFPVNPVKSPGSHSLTASPLRDLRGSA